MQLINVLEGLISEMVVDETYHYTSLYNLRKILEEDTINLSSNLGTSADEYNIEPFFLSLVRSPSLVHGFHSYKEAKSDYKYSIFIARIVFDFKKLKNNYKIFPFNYWGKFISKEKKFEYEDRLLSNKSTIPNIKKYIKKIEILFSDPEKENQKTAAKLKEVAKISEGMGIPIFIYENEEDFTRQRNSKTEEIKKYDYKYENYIKRDYTDYNKIVALILYNDEMVGGGDKYDDMEKQYRNYVENNGIKGTEWGKVYDYFRSIQFNHRDFITSIMSDLHNFFKGGQSSENRKIFELLAKHLRENKVTNIPDLINKKKFGIKSKYEKSTFGKTKYNFFGLDYDGENWGWKPTDLNVPIKNRLDNLYFNTFNHNGFLMGEDMDIFFKMQSEDKTYADFIDYLLAKYSFEKVKEIIAKSSYQQFMDKQFYKIEKKK